MGKGTGDGARSGMRLDGSDLSTRAHALEEAQEVVRGTVTRAVEERYGVSEDIPIQPAKPGLGDYGLPVGLRLARTLHESPVVIADAVAETVSDARFEVSATTGFVNVRASDEWLSSLADDQFADERLGCEVVDPPERIVIDYSAPNIAKTMHVGHLRSTIIGDAISRLHEYRGQTTLKQNHVGDWGTQFGMLVELLEERSLAPDSLEELNGLYRESKARFDADPDFADRARRRVRLLQGGDEATLARWREMVAMSQARMQEVYDRLGVALRIEDVRGESAYNDQLPDVVEALLEAGVARRDEGAVGVFVDGYVGRDGEPVPLLVEKSDGGYMYGTTDLAALRYRAIALEADRILYVTGAGQADHFGMVFATAEAMGWTRSVEAAHIPFGSILDPVTKKPFKTREGDAVSLESLLDRAEARGLEAVRERHPDWEEDEVRSTARDIALAAIKYADLSNGRGKDYTFDVERMMRFDGDTGPYLQYALVRARSVSERAGDEPIGSIRPHEPSERSLVLHANAFPEAIRRAAEEAAPHLLAGYLHRLATRYSGFYDQCPILVEDPDVRASRVGLCRLTERILAQGLELLGIPRPHRM